jgi:hypothetical protein
MSKTYPREIVVDPHQRVTRVYVDYRGREVVATLRWCTTHLEPVWVWDDGSYTCPYDLVIEANTDDHVLDDAPWETP